MYRGMMDICAEFGARIIGGDMVRSPVAFVTVALTGIAAGQPMVRTAALPGHQVAVSGPVGGSAGGLRQLLAGLEKSGDGESELVALHRRPRPHIAAGLALAAAGVNSAMDVSDGLVDDLGKLCTASRCRRPNILRPGTRDPCTLKAAFPDDWLDLALYGGEDYVLLFTAPEDIMSAAMMELGEGASVIGEITDADPGVVTIVDASGVPLTRTGAGWDHFVD